MGLRQLRLRQRSSQRLGCLQEQFLASRSISGLWDVRHVKAPDGGVWPPPKPSQPVSQPRNLAAGRDRPLEKRLSVGETRMVSSAADTTGHGVPEAVQHPMMISSRGAVLGSVVSIAWRRLSRDTAGDATSHRAEAESRWPECESSSSDDVGRSGDPRARDRGERTTPDRDILPGARPMAEGRGQRLEGG